jgi:nitroreductase
VQTNPVIDTMLDHRSVRKYTDEMPPDDVVESVVRAGQQAPFAAQLGSVLLKRGGKGIPFKAPLLFTILVDVHRLEVVMRRRNWPTRMNDLSLLLFGIQDACYMAQNMVVAGRSLGLGSCYIGAAPFRAQAIAKEYGLPPRVFPIVQLTMGYPAEDHPARPRYPLPFALYEERYPEFSDEEIERAMAVMDDGYLAQDYYRDGGRMIELEGDREETFTYDDYSWTEHMGRKWGQWYPSPDELLLEFEKRGFRLTEGTCGDSD